MLPAGVDVRSSSDNHRRSRPPTLADVPLGPNLTITWERRGDIVLVSATAVPIQNRIDPPTESVLSKPLLIRSMTRRCVRCTFRSCRYFLHRGIDVAPRKRRSLHRGQRATQRRRARPGSHGAAPIGRNRSSRWFHGDTVILGPQIYPCEATPHPPRRTRVSAMTSNSHGRCPGGGATCFSFVKRMGNAKLRYMPHRRSLDPRRVVPHGHHAA